MWETKVLAAGLTRTHDSQLGLQGGRVPGSVSHGFLHGASRNLRPTTSSLLFCALCLSDGHLSHFSPRPRGFSEEEEPAAGAQMMTEGAVVP